MIEGVKKGHNGPRGGGKGERWATPERAGTKGKNKQGKKGAVDTAEHRGWLKDKPMGRQGERSRGRDAAREVRLPCRRFVADISFPNLKVGTCGAASHTYRGT